jgi:hypothetical protein
MAKSGPGKTRRTVRTRSRDADRKESLCDIFRTLSDPVSLDVLTVLAANDTSLPDLQEATGLPLPLLSMVLSDLGKKEFVAQTVQDGALRYHLMDPDLLAILKAISE